MNPSRCAELVSVLTTMISLDDIRSCCRSVCADLGFDHFIYGGQLPTLSSIKTIIISGYPSEWRDHYIQQQYEKIDPTVAYCIKNALPVEWGRFSNMDNNPFVEAFFNEGSEFGLKSGISIPIHAGTGGQAMFSFASGSKSGTMREQSLLATPFAQFLSFHLHEAVCRVTNAIETSFDQGSRLTVRESDCLLWTAEGKTSWETSRILGISERTVVFHLQNVCEKLKVPNRLQAVVRAISLGLIVPSS